MGGHKKIIIVALRGYISTRGCCTFMLKLTFTSTIVVLQLKWSIACYMNRCCIGSRVVWCSSQLYIAIQSLIRSFHMFCVFWHV